MRGRQIAFLGQVLIKPLSESGGDEVEELISVSFLEHLPRPGEPGSQLRDLVGPALREQLGVIG